MQNEQLAQNAAMMNYLSRQIEYSFWGGTPPQLEIPKSAITVGAMTFHNVRVDNSVVGAINTGQVHKLDVALNQVRVGGDPAVAEALQKMIQAVLDAKDLTPTDKNGALEHLTYLTEQAGLPKEERQGAAGKTIVQGLERILAASANLTALWSMFKAVFDALF